MSMPLHEQQGGAFALQELRNYLEFGDARGPGFENPLRQDRAANVAPELGSGAVNPCVDERP